MSVSASRLSHGQVGESAGVVAVRFLGIEFHRFAKVCDRLFATAAAILHNSPGDVAHRVIRLQLDGFRDVAGGFRLIARSRIELAESDEEKVGFGRKRKRCLVVCDGIVDPSSFLKGQPAAEIKDRFSGRAGSRRCTLDRPGRSPCRGWQHLRGGEPPLEPPHSRNARCSRPRLRQYSEAGRGGPAQRLWPCHDAGGHVAISHNPATIPASRRPYRAKVDREAFAGAGGDRKERESEDQQQPNPDPEAVRSFRQAMCANQGGEQHTQDRARSPRSDHDFAVPQERARGAGKAAEAEHNQEPLPANQPLKQPPGQQKHDRISGEMGKIGMQEDGRDEPEHLPFEDQGPIQTAHGDEGFKGGVIGFSGGAMPK